MPKQVNIRTVKNKRSEVLRTVKKYGPLRPEKYKNTLDMSPTTFKNHLKNLVKEGHLLRKQIGKLATLYMTEDQKVDLENFSEYQNFVVDVLSNYVTQFGKNHKKLSSSDVGHVFQLLINLINTYEFLFLKKPLSKKRGDKILIKLHDLKKELILDFASNKKISDSANVAFTLWRQDIEKWNKELESINIFL